MKNYGRKARVLRKVPWYLPATIRYKSSFTFGYRYGKVPVRHSNVWVSVADPDLYVLGLPDPNLLVQFKNPDPATDQILL